MTSPITNARVFAIAGPAMLGNLTTPLLGLVATAAIGRLGEAHLLGGVAMAALVFDCIFWLFGFLRMGTVALTAQALGAGDATEQRAVLMRALIVAGLIGLILVALQVPLAYAIFTLMGGSDAVRAAAHTYFVVRIWSAPCALANFALLGWLIGIAHARTALALQIVINAINIALTIVLVLTYDYGIAGAAIAATIAELVGVAIGLYIAFRRVRQRSVSDHAIILDRAIIFDRGKLLRMLSINRDIMIRTAALIAAFAFFTSQGARGGDTLLAANAVLHNFIMIGSFFLDGMATAGEQLCGYCFGARDRDGFVQASRRVIAWGLGFGVILTGAMSIWGDALIDFLTTSSDVRQAARQFMPFATLAPTMGVLAYTFDGIFIGATWARDMRNLMVTAFVIYLVTWWALQPYGNAGLWIALLTFLVVRGLLQALRYPALLRATF